MDKKYILIVVVIAIVAVGAYFLFNGGVGTTSEVTDHSTIVLSKSAYMEVPKSDNKTDNVNSKGIHHYNDKTHDINITSCSNLSDSSSADDMKELKNSIATGSKKLKEGDVVVYEKNGTYSVFVKNTQYNDTLLIQSSSKDLLLICWESVNYHNPAEKINFNDTGSGSVIDVAEKTQTAVSSPSSSTPTSSNSPYGSSWGYEWGSSSSKSSRTSSVGDIASSDDLFDYS